MWKQIADFARKLFSISQRTQKLEESDTELRAEIKELKQQTRDLALALQRLAFEFQRDRENNASERRILLLEIENRFLRFERGLPPPPSDKEE